MHTWSTFGSPTLIHISAYISGPAPLMQLLSMAWRSPSFCFLIMDSSSVTIFIRQLCTLSPTPLSAHHHTHTYNSYSFAFGQASIIDFPHTPRPNPGTSYRQHPQLGSYRRTQTHQHVSTAHRARTQPLRASEPLISPPWHDAPTDGVWAGRNDPGSGPTRPNIRPNPSTDVHGSSTPSRHPRGGCPTHSLTLAATNPSQASSQSAGRFLRGHEGIFSRQRRFDTANGRVPLIPPPPNTMAVPGILCPYARYLLRIPMGAVLDDVRGYPMQGCTNSGHDGSRLYRPTTRPPPRGVRLARIR